MLRRVVLLAGMIAVTFVFLLSGSAQAADKQKIKIGYLLADQLHEYLFPIGVEKGYFAQEGLEVTGLQYVNAGALMQGFAANEMDFATTGVSGAMISKARGLDEVIVGTQNWAGSSLVVDPSINSFKDLAGQPVGDPGTATNHHTLLSMLEKKYNTQVKVVTIKPTDMPTFAKNKEVKGLISYEPWPTRIIKFAGFKRMLTSSQIVKDQQCCVIIALGKMVREHPDIVTKILRVNAEATRFMRDHKAEALKIISKYNGVPVDILDEAYSTNMIYPWPPRVNSVSSKILLQALIDEGLITENQMKPSMDAWWNSLYDSSFEEGLVKNGYIKSLEK